MYAHEDGELEEDVTVFLKSEELKEIRIEENRAVQDENEKTIDITKITWTLLKRKNARMLKKILKNYLFRKYLKL